MITLAASMFELTDIAAGSTQLGEMLFVAVGALVASLVVYGILVRKRRY